MTMRKLTSSYCRAKSDTKQITQKSIRDLFLWWPTMLANAPVKPRLPAGFEEIVEKYMEDHAYRESVLMMPIFIYWMFCWDFRQESWSLLWWSLGVSWRVALCDNWKASCVTLTRLMVTPMSDFVNRICVIDDRCRNWSTNRASVLTITRLGRVLLKLNTQCRLLPLPILWTWNWKDCCHHGLL